MDNKKIVLYNTPLLIFTLLCSFYACNLYDDPLRKQEIIDVFSKFNNKDNIIDNQYSSFFFNDQTKLCLDDLSPNFSSIYSSSVFIKNNRIHFVDCIEKPKSVRLYSVNFDGSNLKEEYTGGENQRGIYYYNECTPNFLYINSNEGYTQFSKPIVCALDLDTFEIKVVMKGQSYFAYRDLYLIPKYQYKISKEYDKVTITGDNEAIVTKEKIEEIEEGKALAKYEYSIYKCFTLDERIFITTYSSIDSYNSLMTTFEYLIDENKIEYHHFAILPFVEYVDYNLVFVR